LQMASEMLRLEHAESKRQSVNAQVLRINPPFALFTPQ
jgi:hypothetical protein